MMECRQRMRILVPWVSCAVAVISLIVLIVIGITQVAPYDQARHFKKIECHLQYFSYNNSMDCDRTPGSFGSYNCILVTVKYKGTDQPEDQNDDQNDDQEEDFISSILYDTEKELHEAKCSYIPRICSVSEHENQEQVLTFEKSLEPRFSCLLDPKDNSRVIRRREVTYKRALHMLLWPTFLLILSIVIAIWGMAKSPRRTNIAYIEVPEKRPRRSIYRLSSQDDQEALTE